MVKYTIVPRAEGCFARCDALTRYAFGLIYDRWRLSDRPESRDRWRDQRGVYCVYERAELAAALGCTLPTLRRCMQCLEAEGLLDSWRAERNGGAYRYYPTFIARTAMGRYDEVLRSLAKQFGDGA